MRFIAKASLITSIALAPGGFAAMQGQTAPAAVSRIVQAVDDVRLVRLAGNVYPAVRTATDLGMTTPELRMDRMQLVLQRGPEQQAALDKFTAEQLDRTSPNFHRWLSPDQFGQLYGVSDGDIATITGWLQSKGFAVNSVSKGRITIEFSGTAGQVQAAFHTEIHNYVVDGEAHIANSSDPQIPAALAPVVVGVGSLHNFYSKSQMVPAKNLKGEALPGRPMLTPGGSTVFLPQASGGSPQYTGGATSYYVSPFDFATIYNLTPLWTAGNNGAGVTVAIAGRSDVLMSDIGGFQYTFGLPLNPPTVIHNGPDPGLLSTTGDQSENSLDVEWAGAAAPGARIALVVSASTNATGGDVLSEQYIVDNQVAPIMSASYGNCELNLGSTYNAFFNSLWQQAAAEGISVFISSGDQAAAGCDNDNLTYHLAVDGLQVNGIASTPYDTAVGGTDFNDDGNWTTYWNASNAANGSSVKGYIPELPWNNSCANPAIVTVNGQASAQADCQAVYALGSSSSTAKTEISNGGGSGGVSACTTPTGSTADTCLGGYSKPSWQVGTGVPADGKRDLPDVSLFAASGVLGNAYLYAQGGYLYGAGGTSFGSPAMAGIMALVVQKQGAAQGLANPVFYQLAASETLANCNTNSVTVGNSCVFYDTTTGNIESPCKNGSFNCTSGTTIGVLTGYNAGTGYDLATGLGTMNVTNLVNAWKSVSGTPAVTVTVTPATLPAAAVGTTYSMQLSGSGGTAPYYFSVTSGALPPWMTLSANGLLSGVPTAVSTFSFTITAKDSSLNGPFAGSQAYTQVVAGASVSTINWVPARVLTYTGLAIGADVLNATSSVPGTFTYSALLANSNPAVSVSATTVLAPGSYTLTATFTPTGGGATSSATIPFTVLVEHVWVVNAAGNLVELDAGGNTLATINGYGGLGIAIDGGGAVWSGNTSGTGLTSFTNSGTAYAGVTGGGLAGTTALAVDGNGYIWVADGGGNAVSQFTNAGVAVSPSGGFTGGNMSAPSGIAIDMSGNVWLSNAGNNSVTEILGAAAPVTPTAAAVTQNSLGVKP